MGAWVRRAATAAAFGLALGGAWAQAQDGIYTCVDAKGKRITSDRYIPECADREQRMLGASGTVRQIVPPTLTAQERDAQERVEHKKQEELQRQAEEKRMLRALLQRYPNKAVHDGERVKALASVEDSGQVARRNLEDLRKERAQLQQESASYKDKPLPFLLKSRLEDNEQQTAQQRRVVASQDEEKKRINDRFDEELAKLKPLWKPPGVAEAAAAAPERR